MRRTAGASIAKAPVFRSHESDADLKKLFDLGDRGLFYNEDNHMVIGLDYRIVMRNDDPCVAARGGASRHAARFRPLGSAHDRSDRRAFG
jgi:hypothetical protein